MFFRSICGDLLITGMEAGNKEMVLSFVRACMEKRDVSTIVLTSHQELAALIQQDQNSGKAVPSGCPGLQKKIIILSTEGLPSRCFGLSA